MIHRVQPASLDDITPARGGCEQGFSGYFGRDILSRCPVPHAIGASLPPTHAGTVGDWALDWKRGCCSRPALLGRGCVCGYGVGASGSSGLVTVLVLGSDLGQKGFASSVRGPGGIGRVFERTTALIAEAALLIQGSRIRYSDVPGHFALSG